MYADCQATSSSIRSRLRRVSAAPPVGDAAPPAVGSAKIAVRASRTANRRAASMLEHPRTEADATRPPWFVTPVICPHTGFFGLGARLQASARVGSVQPL